MNDAALPEAALTAGLLMEGAQSQQRMAATALEALQRHTAGLDTVVRDEIHRTLVETLAEFSAEVARVTRRLEAPPRSLWRVAGLGLGVAALGIGAPLAARWGMPSPAALARLQAEETTLRASVARLRREGGGVQLHRCGTAARLCARIDAKAPRFGEGGEFAVLADD